MAERSFKKEVEALRLGAGDTFHGEGILAVTKALLEAGVSYVGGYQGAPVSHMMDVLEDAQPILDELGVHYEGNASEAAAAAMLGASINYPMRGAVTWKSTVGTNVASDALSNLASAGVKGGAMIILGEDYGDGASIIQERTHAFAMKSQMWLIDPRPNLPTITRMVEKGFELSEASSTPVMLELRIRACHVHGSFETRDNVSPAISRKHLMESADFDFDRICLPPSTYVQERLKIDVRMPAAIAYVREQKLNEVFHGDLQDLGIVMQGGMYNSVMRSLAQLGLADAFGASRIPLYVLNVTYPLVPDEVSQFCAGKRAVLIVEEGQPDYLEQAIHAVLRRADVNTTLHGKDVLPMAGEYTGEVMLRGIAKFAHVVGHATAAFDATAATIELLDRTKRRAREIIAMQQDRCIEGQRGHGRSLAECAVPDAKNRRLTWRGAFSRAAGPQSRDHNNLRIPPEQPLGRPAALVHRPRKHVEFGPALRPRGGLCRIARCAARQHVRPHRQA